MCIVGRKVCGEMLRRATFLPLEAFMTLGERKREKKKKVLKEFFLKEELKKTSKQIKETHGSGKKKQREREKKKKKKEKLLQ